MALKLQTNFKGITAEYWKILKADTGFIEGKTLVRLGLYKDKTAREANTANFIDVKAFIYDIVEATRAELYAKIKEPVIVNEVNTNPFTNAEDC